MKYKHILVIFSLALVALFLSGCAGNGAIASSYAGITVGNETAYLAFDGHIFAVNTTNGTEKWRFPTAQDNKVSFYADPVLTADGQVIAGGFNNVLYSINPTTGAENWKFAAAENRYVASPLATDQAIYVPSADTNLYAVSLQGQLLWSVSTEREAWATPILGTGCDCLYLASLDHKVYAFSLQDGSQLWVTEDLGGAIVSTPALSEDGGQLYLGTFGSEVLAIDTVSGNVAWRHTTEGWVWATPALATDRLYVGDLEGYFYAFDPATGSEVWRVAPTQVQASGPISGTALVTEESVVFGNRAGVLVALNPDGTVNWQAKLDQGQILATPELAGDLILISPNESEVYMFAYSQDGAQKWTFTPAK